jgi:hypothetical protein
MELDHAYLELAMPVERVYLRVGLLKAVCLSVTVQGCCEKNTTISRFHNTTERSNI